jgi:hypothetical protein
LEVLMVKTYDVSLPPRPSKIKSGESLPVGRVDEVSVQVLQHLQPVVLLEMKPLSVVGDGNCFFRAVSLALFGSQELHSLIRLLVLKEIFDNQVFYDIRTMLI